jgi:hypothetical protein
VNNITGTEAIHLDLGIDDASLLRLNSLRIFFRMRVAIKTMAVKLIMG